MNVLEVVVNAYREIQEREELMRSLSDDPDAASSSLTTSLGSSAQVALFSATPLHIPGPEEGGAITSFKTEIVVYDGPGGTIKIVYWRNPDPRGDILHNHPWCSENGVSFVSYICAGGYTEKILRQGENGEWIEETRRYRSGDKNVCMYDAFHNVVEVLPETITVMVTGPRVPSWSHLIMQEDGNHEIVASNDPRCADSGFFPRLVAINPHKRK